MRGAPEPAKLRLQACPHVVWNGHTAAGGVVVRHLHRSRLRDQLARLRVHDLIFEREAAVANRDDTKADDESISRDRRLPVVAFDASQDDVAHGARLTAQTLPVRESSLLEVRQVDGVIDVPERITIAEADFEFVFEPGHGQLAGESPLTAAGRRSNPRNAVRLIPAAASMTADAATNGRRIPN